MKAIAAADENWGIGYQGGLLCRVSADLKRFRALTLGKTVILGRKTLNAFPGKKPLPGRENWILSTTMKAPPEGGRVFHSLEALLAEAPEDAFVIGGAEVYRELLPYCDTVYLTKIHAAFPADARFPDLDRDGGWKITETEGPMEEDGLQFSYVTYRREVFHEVRV